MLNRLRQYYPAPLIFTDLLAFVPAFWFAGLLRNEVNALNIRWSQVVQIALLTAVMFVVVGWFSHLYRNRFRVATFEEVLILGGAWGVSAGAALIVNLLLYSPRVPTSLFGMGAMLVGLSMILSRVVWRVLRRSEMRPDSAGRKRVLVFGAGDGGTQVVKSMLGDASSRYVPVGLIDDDRRKRNRIIEGVRVVGTTESIGSLKNRADLLLIAVPSASPELISRVQSQATVAGLDVMILPSTTELFGMMATIDTARPIEITDLLGRDEVDIDEQSVSDYLTGKVVLVTGAGGSIGSELCRQILRYEPERLVMLDRDETNLQGVQISVAGHGLLDDENLVLANIRDRDRVFEVFEHHRPSIVFHAAALKHLPLIEAHPREGLLTNVFGTKNVLDAAAHVGVDHFVNVSTDKAANPTSVLGTTKRLAEALTLQIGAKHDGEWLSVRFGNVIGSRGSVLPAFEAQIAKGGPVTVTHPEVTRYFMSIPEASRLVLQAGAIGTTGETLVLDMGEPMKIVDLAEKLIAHHNSDVEIIFTGLRPKEKLHEVLGHDGEELLIGAHPRIMHTSGSGVVNVPLDELREISGEALPAELLALVNPLDTEPQPAS